MFPLSNAVTLPGEQCVCAVCLVAHTPDNSFMGFVSEELGQGLEEDIQEHKEPNVAVVYGKQDYMWQVMRNCFSLNIGV